MLAAAHSAAVLGIDALDVTVEVHVANGLPQWIRVGIKPRWAGLAKMIPRLLLGTRIIVFEGRRERYSASTCGITPLWALRWGTPSMKSHCWRRLPTHVLAMVELGSSEAGASEGSVSEWEGRICHPPILPLLPTNRPYRDDAAGALASQRNKCGGGVRS